MVMVLKRQRFEDSKSEETEPKVPKHQRMGMHNDKERLSLDKYKDERKNVKYVPLPFVAPSPPRKESNRPTDMGKQTKNLNHLVCIPKIGLSDNC